MSFVQPPDHLKGATEEVLRACFYDRRFLEDSTLCDGHYCTGCGWKVSKHPAAAPPAVPAASGSASAADIAMAIARLAEKQQEPHESYAARLAEMQ